MEYNGCQFYTTGPILERPYTTRGGELNKKIGQFRSWHNTMSTINLGFWQTAQILLKVRVRFWVVVLGWGRGVCVAFPPGR